MKDGTGAEPDQVSRLDLYEAYRSWYRQSSAEVRPCRGGRLLRKTAQFLRTEPDLRDTFTVFPFHQALTDAVTEERGGARVKKQLSAFIRAAEILETLCLNLLVQPWRKEIRTLKINAEFRRITTIPLQSRFLSQLDLLSEKLIKLFEKRGGQTGKRLQQMLAPISQGGDSDNINVGRECIIKGLCVYLNEEPENLVRVYVTFTGPFVYFLLPVLSSSTLQSVLASIGYLPHDDASQSEFRLGPDVNPDRAGLVGFELLLARVECHHLLELLIKDQVGPQEWLELLQRRQQPPKHVEHTQKKTTPPHRDSQAVSNPQPKPRLDSVDQSIIEMKRTYPDLVFMGRPLLPDKPQKCHGSTGSGKADTHAEPSAKVCFKGSEAGAPAPLSRDDGSKGEPMFGDSSRTGGRNGRISGGASSQTETSSSNCDGNEAEDNLGRTQALSLHITLRAEPKAHYAAEPADQTEQQSVLL